MKREGLRFVLIGHPVAHSLSPAIHHAAYAELGLEGNHYEAVDCPDEDAVLVQLDAIRRGEIAGANVTVPWKRFALEHSDEREGPAKVTFAANVLVAKGPPGDLRIVAHNTDVPALALELLRRSGPVQRAVVIGSGGAALAAVSACRAIGAADIAVVARRFRGTRAPTWPGAEELAELGARPVAWPDDVGVPSEWRSAVCEAEVIVQSTSDGMAGSSDGTSVERIVPWEDVRKDVLAYDLVYNPAVTRFVAAARSRGLKAESGLGMLVGQAALAVELWLGERPAEGPLRTAALRALAQKSAQ